MLFVGLGVEHYEEGFISVVALGVFNKHLVFVIMIGDGCYRACKR